MIDLSPYVQTGDKAFEFFKQPFTVVDSKGSVWNIACNWQWLACVQDKSRYKRWTGDAKGLNVMLSLLRLLPETRYLVPTDKLVEWAATDGLGKVFEGVVVCRERVRELLKLDPTGRLQLWDASSAVQGLPCLGMGSKGIRLFLMGNDLAKVPQDASIAPLDPGLVGELANRDPEHDEPERDGFDLAMSLGD
jgi:hypothetical protein